MRRVCVYMYTCIHKRHMCVSETLCIQVYMYTCIKKIDRHAFGDVCTYPFKLNHLALMI